MYQALYRKYRPIVFSDVVGQEHITSTLAGGLKNGKVFHAYLFTGTRGTGKTTCAKILAKAVCCENLTDGQPCGECAACKAIAEGNTTDISEIDAASNNGVNDIRDLKEQVSFLPVSLKYRVYIIDEVHMLSQSAFNALLKTLEEPPSHVIFILATTEVHKLPATILSRCQRFDFKRLEPDVICGRMQYIAQKEGFTLTDGAATMIASLADGGMRDALSILDQCSVCAETVDEAVIAEVCGIAGNERIFEIIKAVHSHNAADAIKIVDDMYRNSVDMKKLLYELVSAFRNLMIIKTVQNPKGLMVCSEDEFSRFKQLAEGFTLSQIIDSLTALQLAAEAMSVTASRSDVELTIVKLCTPELASSAAGLKARIEKLEKTVMALTNGEVAVPVASPKQEKIQAEPVKEAKVEAQPVIEEEIPLPDEPNEAVPLDEPVAESKPKAEKPALESTAKGEPTPVSQWPEIMELIKKACPLMAGVLTGSKAYIGGGRLLIDSKLSQFKDLINSDAKYRDYIRNAAEQVLGVSYNLGPYKPATKNEQEVADPLAEFKKSLENL